MRPRIRKLAVVVGTTALLGGSVAGCGSSASTTSASGGATTAQAQAGQNGGPGAMSTTTLKTLAAKLGVSTTELQTAMQSARPTGTPSSTSSADPQAQMATAIAKALDLSETKVASALEAVMPAAPGGTPPTGTTASS